MRFVKTKISIYCKYCDQFRGFIANIFCTVSQIISTGSKNIFTNFESSILKCTILPLLKAYAPYQVADGADKSKGPIRITRSVGIQVLLRTNAQAGAGPNNKRPIQQRPIGQG